MKKFILPIMAFAALTTSLSHADTENTHVTLVPSDEAVAEDAVATSLSQTRVKLSELARNNSIVLENYDAFAGALDYAYRKEKSVTAEEVKQICSGVEFAADKHRLQTRKNTEKTPYICHPIGVAYNLMKIGNVRDLNTILGALLHDTLEDTQTTADELKAKFGDQVASLVNEVTDNRTLAVEARKRLQVINAPSKSTAAAQIKLADKLYNLNDLLNNPPADWTQARTDRYYEWAQSVVDRLPPVNDPLLEAVDETINAYWEKQRASKS